MLFSSKKLSKGKNSNYSPSHPPSFVVNNEFENGTEQAHKMQEGSQSTNTNVSSYMNSKTQQEQLSQLQEKLERLSSVPKGLNQIAVNTGKTPQNNRVVIAKNNEVVLVCSSAFPMSQFGNSSCSRTYTVKMKNFGAEKLILLRGKDVGGKYMELTAQYIRSLNNGEEIWKAHSEQEHGFKSFTVNYISNTTEYVDNNNGQEYTDDGFTGVNLYNGINVSRWSATTLVGTDNTTIEIGVHVKNLCFKKSVEVWFTTDNWASKSVAPLEFQECERHGAGYVTSPNSVGVEYWFNTIDVGKNVSSIEYCIRYSSEKGEFWDNNWGKNYEANRLVAN